MNDDQLFAPAPPDAMIESAPPPTPMVAESRTVLGGTAAERAGELVSPVAWRRRLEQLAGARKTLQARRDLALTRQTQALEFLAIAEKVANQLDKLSEELFGQTVRLLEEKLSLALAEVLEQPLQFKATCGYKRNSATISFHVERDGAKENIMEGQGGSVANVLSVCLRMFALARQDPEKHRLFLVLDEQDCWLRPDLVPRLVKIVHQAGKAFGFQVIMISHHDASLFAHYADKIYDFHPTPEGVRVVQRHQDPRHQD